MAVLVQEHPATARQVVPGKYDSAVRTIRARGPTYVSGPGSAPTDRASQGHWVVGDVIDVPLGCARALAQAGYSQVEQIALADG